MKRIYRKINSLSLLLIVALLLFVIPAIAQHVYLGMYWIAGNVSAPEGIAAEGRQVVFYQTNPDDGYAEGIVGVSGLAGRANEYMLNAYQDWRMVIAPGTYQVAIPRGDDGYGANPVEVVITGQGYDLAAENLVLAAGAGIEEPSDRPESIAGMAPVFSDITFGNRRYQRALVDKGKPFIVSDRPRIAARVSSSFGVNLASLLMSLNAGSRLYKIQTSNIVSIAGPDAAPTDISFVYDFEVENNTPLPDGEQELALVVNNSFGSTSEVFTLTVMAGEARLVGVPVSYPSPLRLSSTRVVTFQYTLSQDAAITIAVFDISGRMVKRLAFSPREDGGSAGVNKVSWDLITDQGTGLGAGIFVFTISTGDNKLLAKGKFTSLP